MGILLEVIDEKGYLGGKGSHLIGRKQRIPMDGHPPRQDFMAGSTLRNPRGAV